MVAGEGGDAMKLLRNPVVVVILAVLALALVVRNVFWPMLGGIRWRKAPARVAAPAVAATPPAKASPVEQTVAAIKSILGKDAAQPAPVVIHMDTSAAREGATHWVQSPRRDPFHSKFVAESRTAQLLKLKGVWRQTGGGLAVINNQLLGEGDAILDYRVEKIETDQVWVTGPYGREAVGFILPVLGNDLRPAKLALESEARQ